MKQFLTCLLGILLFSSVAMAQQFSSSLGGGGSSSFNRTNRTIRTRTNTKSMTKKKDYKNERVIRTVLHYDPSQINLDKENEEQVMKIVNRIQERNGKSIEIVGIARDYNTASQRINLLRRLFLAYTPKAHVAFRHMAGALVFDSNDNTVEIYEHY